MPASLHVLLRTTAVGVGSRKQFFFFFLHVILTVQFASRYVFQERECKTLWKGVLSTNLEIYLNSRRQSVLSTYMLQACNAYSE
jgi:hypothetical protein